MPYKRMDCLFDFHANVAWFGICGKQEARHRETGAREPVLRRCASCLTLACEHSGVDATASTVGGDEGAVQERVPSGAVACKDLSLRDERIERVLDHLPILQLLMMTAAGKLAGMLNITTWKTVRSPSEVGVVASADCTARSYATLYWSSVTILDFCLAISACRSATTFCESSSLLLDWL